MLLNPIKRGDIFHRALTCACLCVSSENRSIPMALYHAPEVASVPPGRRFCEENPQSSSWGAGGCLAFQTGGEGVMGVGAFCSLLPCVVF